MRPAKRKFRPALAGAAVGILVALATYIWAGGVFDLWTGLAVAGLGGLVAALVATRLFRMSAGPQSTAGDYRSAQTEDDPRVVRPGLLALTAGMVCAVSGYVYLGPNASLTGYGLIVMLCVTVMAATVILANRLNK